MNLNTFSNYISRGNYDVLISHGNAALSPDVTFDTLVIKGILQTTCCRGRRIIIDGGMLNASGGIATALLSGHGCVTAGKSIEATAITFIGELSTAYTLKANHCVQVNGVLSAKSLTTKHATIVGHIDIGQSAQIHNLEVMPMHTAMFERFGMNKYLKANSIEQIVADNVTLSNTICRTIDADAISLSHHTQVRKAIYSKELKFDRTSNVTVIEHRRSEDTDDGIQRKVA
ncbi:hypothetical protein [Bifidobacterium sp. ESL0745]|uniref:hypothetical protein n=1 Tax=Bifidobacterium sp. ESL0745 TaxID=2983226 RepID=UPI0023F7388F|nr:hypothetical protein [Bifidobacterium sp. ESL0745]MDF7664970.1 hypothetical protein [Bifidobacterium sp. ESL0745]